MHGCADGSHAGRGRGDGSHAGRGRADGSRSHAGGVGVQMGLMLGVGCMQ